MDSISLPAWLTGGTPGLVAGSIRSSLPVGFLLAGMGLVGAPATAIGPALPGFIETENARTAGTFLIAFSIMQVQGSSVAPHHAASRSDGVVARVDVRDGLPAQPCRRSGCGCAPWWRLYLSPAHQLAAMTSGTGGQGPERVVLCPKTYWIGRRVCGIDPGFRTS